MIVLTGGKTGGHIMPLLAVAEKLNNVCYIGALDSLEERLCMERHIPFIGIKIKHNRFIEALKCTFQLRLKDVEGILSTGGYVSFPVLLYGIFHRIPIYLLEENVIIGRTNRFFKFFAKKIFFAFPPEKMKKKYRVVGIPTLLSEQAKIKPLAPTYDLLIIGGSLGSKPLCDLIYPLKEKYRVCLVASRYYEEYKNVSGVQVYPYVKDLPSLMQQSTVVISRAGAATTYEIFTIGKPCIIVPSRNTSKNHQYLNGLYFEKRGCCKLLKEKDAATQIIKMVTYLMEHKETRDQMVQMQSKLVISNASQKIIEEMKYCEF